MSSGPALWIDRSAFSFTHSFDYRLLIRAPSSMNYANETKQNATACNRNNEKRRKKGKNRQQYDAKNTEMNKPNDAQ